MYVYLKKNKCEYVNIDILVQYMCINIYGDNFKMIIDNNSTNFPNKNFKLNTIVMFCNSHS